MRSRILTPSILAAFLFIVAGISCGESKGPQAVSSTSTDSKEALEALVRRLGGLVVPEKENPGAYFVNLRGAALDGRQVEEISRFRGIVDLALGSSNVGDEELARLVTLKNLRRLDLSFTLVTRKGVAVLGGLPLLNDLDLSRTRIHSEEFECVKLLQGLKVLVLDRSQTTFDALQQFEGHKVLDAIFIQDDRVRRKVWARGPGTKGSEEYWTTPIGATPPSSDYKHVLEATVRRIGGRMFPEDDAPESIFVNLTDVPLATRHLEELSRFQSIVNLSLSNSKVDDAAMASVARFQNLRSLYLSGTQVTSRGISLLGDLPSLTFLDLEETKIHGEDFACIGKLRALKRLHLDRSQTTMGALRHFDRHPSLQEIHMEHEGVGYTVWDRHAGIKRSEWLWREDRAPGDRTQVAEGSQIRADTSYSWARFKPGASVKMRQSMNGDVTLESMHTLREVTENEVVLEAAYTLVPIGMEDKQEERASLYRLDQDSIAEETLKVEGKDYRCKVFKTDFEVRTGNVEIRHWIADGVEFPVKIIRITTGATDATSELTLVSLDSELPIGGRRMKCVKYEGTFAEMKSGKAVEGHMETTWMCAEIPGGMVRREIRNDRSSGRGPTVHEVIAYEVKK